MKQWLGINGCGGKSQGRFGALHVVLFTLLLLLESFFLVISALPAQISMQGAFGDVELMTYPGGTLPV